ncbi:MAG TPA: TRAP transporter substrate-binding protein [Polyangiaceae bacterium]
MKKRGLRLAAGLSFLGFLCAPAANAAPDVTIRVVTPFATGHILADAAFKFKEQVEFKSKGKVAVTVATSVLNEQTINPQMTSCDASQRVGDVMLTGGQPIQDWAPQYFFFNGPYVIEDYDHFQGVWFSHLGEEARALMNQNGNQVTLGTVYRGFRQFTSNEPILGPADFVGFKLRLPAVPDWVAVWSSLGVQQVIVPLGGIYAALANGTAEGSEGDLTQILSLRLYEVQSHLSLTSHLVGFGLATANECFLDGLNQGQENMVVHEMQAATDWATARMFSLEAGLLSTLQSNGMTVVQPDAGAIRAAAEPAINNLFATKWTVTTWQEVLSY